MKPLTREWVNKAEGDFATATRETRARKSPNRASSPGDDGFLSRFGTIHPARQTRPSLDQLDLFCDISFGKGWLAGPSPIRHSAP